MSRSGYTEVDDWEMDFRYVRWRGTVARAIRGKRGQAFLRDMLEALDALPEKRLAASVLVADGECCAMGAVALQRGIDTSGVDPCEREEVAKLFGIAGALAAEIAYENDSDYCPLPASSSEARWKRMRHWVVRNLVANDLGASNTEGGTD